MSALENLRAEVEQTQSAIDSAIIFINGIANRLREALMGGNVEAQVTELADELDSAQAKLATAIAANTNADEDSDDNFDPTPIGEEYEDNTEAVEFADPDEPVAQDEGDEDVPNDTGAGVDAELNSAEEQVTGNTENLPTVDEAVNPDNADDTDSSTANGQTAA